jgi:hypothetical protein
MSPAVTSQLIVQTRQGVVGLGLVLVVLTVAACGSGGRDAPTLAATTFGQFTAPPGSSVVKESYEPEKPSGVFTHCASYTRVFGTNDASSFQAAVYSTALAAGWSSDQSEAISPFPMDGMTAVFRGEREIVQLRFLSSAAKSRPVEAMQDVRFDWGTYRLAVVLEVLDGSYARCEYQIAPGLTRVSGRVTSSASALPLADVGVTAHQIVGGAATFGARTDADGRYSFEWRLQSPIRVSFNAGLGYRVAWWRDATSFETATDLAVSRAQRNLAIDGIDVRLEPPSIPSGSVINVVQRYDLAQATSLTITACPAASQPLATGCLGSSRVFKREDSLLVPFARALDAELARVPPEAPRSSYVQVVFGFGTPPPPGEYRLIAGSYVAFVYEDGLLSMSTPRDEIAVRAPEAFVQMVEASR